MIEKPGRNIVLTASRVAELDESGCFRSDAAILRRLAETDPEHGNNAHMDLAEIVRLLETLSSGQGKKSG
jgi:hypothetical protein